jgi:cyclopropane-fatty-acyl-phospholipid synthase
LRTLTLRVEKRMPKNLPDSHDRSVIRSMDGDSPPSPRNPNVGRGPDRWRRRAEHMLALANVRINGWGDSDLVVHDERVFARVFAHGSMGFGESYMDGDWDARDLPGLMSRLLGARLDEQLHTIDAVLLWAQARFLNMQRGRRAYAVGQRHYDLGNDLFEAMLGERMVYSCGYWANATDLDSAQEAKLDLVCRKLRLRPGMRVLDIGCGWGEALKFAAERYGVSGVGLTISCGQAPYARRLCAGLPVEIRLQDYRDLHGQFDAIFSIGMFEHVGAHNYRQYFDVVRRCLKPDGLSLLHTIGSNQKPDRPDPWIERYIFPNSQVPAMSQVAKALESRFVVEDWHNFGADYERTLLAWMANIEAAWPQLSGRYDERFRRMWRFYLAASAATFRVRRDQLWQITLSPKGVEGGYRAPR